MDDGYDSCEPYVSDDALSEGDIDFLSDGQEEAKSIQLAPATWTVIDAAGLAQAQEEALKSVTGILGCSRSTARIMLIHFRWNTETLFGVLAERGEECVYRMSGITSRSTEPPTPSGARDEASELPCGTCFCDVPLTEATTMECGHAFCNDCWRQHLVIQIEDGRARRLPCMGVRCGAICEESKVRALIGDDREALAKYKRCLLESYVDDNAQVRWCPSVPHCGRALRAEGEPHCEPECSCGLRFCFACGEEPHSPCTCEMCGSGPGMWLQHKAQINPNRRPISGRPGRPIKGCG